MAKSFRKQKSKYVSRESSRLRKDYDTQRSFTRRAFLIGGIQASVLGVLGGRLAWLQIVQGQKYRVLSDQNRINVKIKAPERGQIIDRFGVPLATNERDYRLVMIPEQAGDLFQSLETLSQHIAFDSDKIEMTVKRAQRTPSFFRLKLLIISLGTMLHGSRSISLTFQEFKLKPAKSVFIHMGNLWLM